MSCERALDQNFAKGSRQGQYKFTNPIVTASKVFRDNKRIGWAGTKQGPELVYIMMIDGKSPRNKARVRRMNDTTCIVKDHATLPTICPKVTYTADSIEYFLHWGFYWFIQFQAVRDRVWPNGEADCVLHFRKAPYGDLSPFKHLGTAANQTPRSKSPRAIQSAESAAETKLLHEQLQQHVELVRSKEEQIAALIADLNHLQATKGVSGSKHKACAASQLESQVANCRIVKDTLCHFIRELEVDKAHKVQDIKTLTAKLYDQEAHYAQQKKDIQTLTAQLASALYMKEEKEHDRVQLQRAVQERDTTIHNLRVHISKATQSVEPKTGQVTKLKNMTFPLDVEFKAKQKLQDKHDILLARYVALQEEHQLNKDNYMLLLTAKKQRDVQMVSMHQKAQRDSQVAQSKLEAALNASNAMVRSLRHKIQQLELPRMQEQEKNALIAAQLKDSVKTRDAKIDILSVRSTNQMKKLQSKANEVRKLKSMLTESQENAKHGRLLASHVALEDELKVVNHNYTQLQIAKKRENAQQLSEYQVLEALETMQEISSSTFVDQHIKVSDFPKMATMRRIMDALRTQGAANLFDNMTSCLQDQYGDAWDDMYENDDDDIKDVDDSKDDDPGCDFDALCDREARRVLFDVLYITYHYIRVHRRRTFEKVIDSVAEQFDVSSKQNKKAKQTMSESLSVVMAPYFKEYYKKFCRHSYSLDNVGTDLNEAIENIWEYIQQMYQGYLFWHDRCIGEQFKRFIGTCCELCWIMVLHTPQLYLYPRVFTVRDGQMAMDQFDVNMKHIYHKTHHHTPGALDEEKESKRVKKSKKKKKKKKKKDASKMTSEEKMDEVVCGHDFSPFQCDVFDIDHHEFVNQDMVDDDEVDGGKLTLKRHSNIPIAYVAWPAIIDPQPHSEKQLQVTKAFVFTHDEANQFMAKPLPN